VLYFYGYRAFNIFPLSWILNRYRADKISMKNQFIMWFSGLRGAIAFALSLNFPTQGTDGGEVRRAIISTTLSIVLFTVIVLGGGTMPLLRLLRVEGADSAETDVVHSRFIENHEEEQDDHREHPDATDSLHYQQSYMLRKNNNNPTRERDEEEEEEETNSTRYWIEEAPEEDDSHPSRNRPLPLPSSSLGFPSTNFGRSFGIFQYIDNYYLKPCFRVAHTRTGEATERALRRIASTRGRYLTPHEIGSYLEAAAEEVAPSCPPSPLQEEQTLWFVKQPQDTPTSTNNNNNNNNDDKHIAPTNSSSSSSWI